LQSNNNRESMTSSPGHQSYPYISKNSFIITDYVGIWDHFRDRFRDHLVEIGAQSVTGERSR